MPFSKMENEKVDRYCIVDGTSGRREGIRKGCRR
jgi:hypothetical protein